VVDLLSLLEEAGDKPLSGAVIGRRLGLTRAAVHKRIARLRAQGHLIEGAPRIGYLLKRHSDRPSSGDYKPGWGRPFHYFETIPSTQDAAKLAAAQGTPEGALFIAERQTAGRGRLGRRWDSPAGGLWYSLLLRPNLAPSAAPGLALAAALDWARLLEKRGLPARVKWPNDVWIGRRKLGGILTEMSSEADRVQWVVLGIGVNVNNPVPKGLLTPGVSLKGAKGKNWSRADLLSEWMARFAETYAGYLKGGFPTIRKEFERLSLLRGRDARFELEGRGVLGRVLGVDAEGRLRIRSGGREQTISVGDVRPA
jgi:BirA family biotin operon repressor/biotin-[acetyl-CoA-carboxylase] ligase